ncbi:MAG TPA: carboxypeptidase-like regulatory domain-containing protein [Vicinamibacteria bacterium]|nr:carboxypeptidase-like regulatory domain-containing protein [Vicinamibacteria bacterium]
MRPLRRAAHVFLALLLALPVGEVRSAPATGTIQGVVRLEGRPLSGVTVAFIELQSGSIVRAVSSGDGAFSTVAPTGEYAVTTESQAGLAVGQAPVKVAVADGRVASADVELVAVASAVTQDPAAVPPPQDPAAPASDPQVPADSQAPAASAWATTSGTGAQILFEPVTCFIAGEFPLLDTGIEPVASVARARVYFKGAVGDSFYYVEMSLDQGRYFGKLPRPRVEASPITYYVQSTTTEFEESQTQEIEALVVQDKAECGDRKVAAIGPAGAVTVFSAATGASIVAPAGFAAVAASGLAVGAITVIAAAAAAAGVVGGVVVAPPGGGGGVIPPPILINPSPIPAPTAFPSPTPVPVPTPITTFR